MFRPGLILVGLDAAAFHREALAVIACALLLYQAYVIEKTVVTRERWAILMAELQTVIKTSVVCSGLYLFLRLHWDFLGGQLRNAARWHEHASQHKRNKASKK